MKKNQNMQNTEATNQKNNSPNQQIFVNGVKKSSSIKKEKQIKSIVLLAITAVALVIVCLLFFVLSKTDPGNDNGAPKDYYMDINVGTGQHRIQICDIVNELQIVSEFSTPENKPYVEVVGGTSDVFCFADGTVTSITQNENKGYIITIEHIPGMYTIYTNVEPTDELNVGAKVLCGDLLGIMNQDEPIILRFSISLGGQYIDPTPYLIH